HLDDETRTGGEGVRAARGGGAELSGVPVVRNAARMCPRRESGADRHANRGRARVPQAVPASGTPRGRRPPPGPGSTRSALPVRAAERQAPSEPPSGDRGRGLRLLKGRSPSRPYFREDAMKIADAKALTFL